MKRGISKSTRNRSKSRFTIKCSGSFFLEEDRLLTFHLDEDRFWSFWTGKFHPISFDEEHLRVPVERISDYQPKAFIKINRYTGGFAQVRTKGVPPDISEFNNPGVCKRVDYKRPTNGEREKPKRKF